MLHFVPLIQGGIKIGELIFIGMGLGDEKGLSLSALENLKKADNIFVENYTGLIEVNIIENLKKMIGKEITLADRATVEDGKIILESTENNNRTVLLTVGDPMSATTHIDLQLRAHHMGHETRIIHGSSIFTAAPGACGLQHYKFGRTVTLVFPQGNYFPESPYMMIGENLRSGYHTLVLLELTTEEDRIMTATDGIRLLLELEARNTKGYFKADTLVCVVARAGSEDVLIRPGYANDLKDMDFGGPMHCLIIPGKLHFKEAEALVKLYGAPEEILKEDD